MDMQEILDELKVFVRSSGDFRAILIDTVDHLNRLGVGRSLVTDQPAGACDTHRDQNPPRDGVQWLEDVY